MLHDLPDIAIALIVLAAIVVAWPGGDDDPIWRERWRALSPADRNRIAAAARSGKLLASQDEIELAAGYARRDRRRSLPYAVLEIVRIPVGIALIAAGLVADAPVFIFFGALFFFGGVWLLIKGRRTARGLRETISRTPGL